MSAVVTSSDRKTDARAVGPQTWLDDTFCRPCWFPAFQYLHERSYAISSPSAALQPAGLQAKSQKDATKDSEVKLFTMDDRRNAFVFAFHD